MYDKLNDHQIQVIWRKAQLYDALTAEPGRESLNTLMNWIRLVEGTEGAIGDRLTGRINRLQSHAEGGGNPNAGEHDPSLRD